jgi:prepilin-type N-terminal cleavage/methylation domain-containing protein
MASTRGFTLPELVLVLLVAGVAVRLGIGPAIHQADSLVLRGVREELVALFHRARVEARLHGQARISLAEGGDPYLTLPGDRRPIRLFLRARGVELDLLGPRTELEVAFGPLGTARFAAASLLLRKRDSLLPLTVSAYGRVRR